MVRAAVDGQLLRDAAAAAPPDPALFFNLLLLLSSSLQITTTGAPHTQSFYTAETTWGFPPTGQKIKIIEPRCLQTADTRAFYYGNATGAHRLRVFSSHLNAPPPRPPSPPPPPPPSYLVLSGTICSFTRLLYSNERNPKKKTRLYSVSETIQTTFIL